MEWDRMKWDGTVKINAMGWVRYSAVQCVTLSDRADAGL